MKIRVAAFPAFKRKENPYQVLLYNAIQSAGDAKVDEFTWKHILFHSYHIIHVHWPESNKLRKTRLTAISYIIAFNTLLLISKWKGAKVIWTVHNLQSHEKKFPLLNHLQFYLFTKMVDGIIMMNQSVVQQITSKYIVLKNKPFKQIAHGHYKDWYENKISTLDARALFKLSNTHKVFLTLGNIRPYKGLEALIESFKQTNDPSYKLIIAGKADKDMRLYKNKLEQLINNDERIIFRPVFIADDELQYYFNAADVVMLSYTKALNSGVLLLALSFNKTIAMPYFESMIQLQEEFKEWVYTYNNLDNSVYECALQKAEINQGKSTDMTNGNWNNIALQTIEFYKEFFN